MYFFLIDVCQITVKILHMTPNWRSHVRGLGGRYYSWIYGRSRQWRSIPTSGTKRAGQCWGRVQCSCCLLCCCQPCFCQACCSSEVGLRSSESEGDLWKSIQRNRIWWVKRRADSWWSVKETFSQNIVAIREWKWIRHPKC